MRRIPVLLLFAISMIGLGSGAVVFTGEIYPDVLGPQSNVLAWARITNDTGNFNSSVMNLKYDGQIAGMTYLPGSDGVYFAVVDPPVSIAQYNFTFTPAGEEALEITRQVDPTGDYNVGFLNNMSREYSAGSPLTLKATVSTGTTYFDTSVVELSFLDLKTGIVDGPVGMVWDSGESAYVLRYTLPSSEGTYALIVHAAHPVNSNEQGGNVFLISVSPSLKGTFGYNASSGCDRVEVPTACEPGATIELFYTSTGAPADSVFFSVTALNDVDLVGPRPAGAFIEDVQGSGNFSTFFTIPSDLTFSEHGDALSIETVAYKGDLEEWDFKPVAIRTFDVGILGVKSSMRQGESPEWSVELTLPFSGYHLLPSQVSLLTAELRKEGSTEKVLSWEKDADFVYDQDLYTATLRIDENLDPGTYILEVSVTDSRGYHEVATKEIIVTNFETAKGDFAVGRVVFNLSEIDLEFSQGGVFRVPFEYNYTGTEVTSIGYSVIGDIASVVSVPDKKFIDPESMGNDSFEISLPVILLLRDYTGNIVFTVTHGVNESEAIFIKQMPISVRLRKVPLVNNTLGFSVVVANRTFKRAGLQDLNITAYLFPLAEGGSKDVVFSFSGNVSSFLQFRENGGTSETLLTNISISKTLPLYFSVPSIQDDRDFFTGTLLAEHDSARLELPLHFIVLRGYAFKSNQITFSDKELVRTFSGEGPHELSLIIGNEGSDAKVVSFQLGGEIASYARLLRESVTVEGGAAEELFIEFPASSVCDGVFTGKLIPLLAPDAEIGITITILDSGVDCSTLEPEVRLVPGSASSNLGNQVEGAEIKIPLTLRNEGAVTLADFEFSASDGSVTRALSDTFQLESSASEDFTLMLDGVGRSVRSIEITVTAYDVGGQRSSSDSAVFTVSMVDDTASKLKDLRDNVQSLVNKMQGNANLTKQETEELDDLINTLQNDIEEGLRKFSEGDYSGSGSTYVRANSILTSINQQYDEYNVPDGPPLTLIILLVLVILVVIGFVVYLSLVPEEEEFS